MWILTVSADGAVPVAYRVADGNTSDDVTHIPTWDELVALVGRADFLYVADCKLANREAMAHIHEAGGRFVTVLPRTRKEDAWFRDWVQDHTPEWVEAARRGGARRDDPEECWRTFEAPVPSAEGHRIVWVHSSSKALRDAQSRSGRIAAGVAALDELAGRLRGPKTRLRTRVAVEGAATAALAKRGAERWVGFEVSEVTEESYRQERRGRPGASTRYRKHTRTRFDLTWGVRVDVVAYDAATDGCFPLISNDRVLSPAEVLAAYKYQPNLERRHAQLKGHQLVAPVFLHDPARIEGLLVCHFVALVTQALIEREIRSAMKSARTNDIPLYPEFRACTAPSAARVLEIFTGLARHHLVREGRIVQIEPTLTPLQLQVLELPRDPGLGLRERGGFRRLLSGG